MFTLFFIRRPIVACVLSILIILLGAVSYPTLPVAQYPDITPPQIKVSTIYPGASAQVVADTVASPIEQQVNGVDGMLYLESKSSSDGTYTLNVTFEVGTNIDIAQVLVQNRVNAALARLPEDVRQQGVTTAKVSSSLVAVVALIPQKDTPAAQDPTFTDLYLSNFLVINLNDQVRRIKGIGDTTIFPNKDYGMRVWLDPDKLRAQKLTTVDIINALQEQNVQVAAGVIGQPPVPKGQGFEYTVSTLGRLETPEQFESIIIKVEEGRLTRLKDVARIELGAKSYSTLGRTNGVPCGVMVVYLSPGGNSVQVAEDFRKLLASVGKDLPAGLEYRIIYDTSNFVVSAIDEVYKTLIEAVVLVVLVVLVFLASFRATIIPILAIPVSLIGTFFFMKIFGFSLNLPTHFGLVLAIGIVVDDAIVGVENVERVMTESHLPPKEATAKAMIEVFGAVVGISLVLMAVFLPTAALPGISGQLFKQFALTIAASTFLSAVCALTLSPALAGIILKGHKPGQKHNIFKRTFDGIFNAISNVYARFIRFLVHPAVIGFSLLAFAGCVVAIVLAVQQVPTGFVPEEDKGLVVTEIWMPDSASQERTLEVIRKVEKIVVSVDGAADATALQGFSIINGNGSKYAVIFTALKPWSERVPKGRSIGRIIGEMQSQYYGIQDAIVFAFSLPAVDGVGNAAGFDLRVQDRSGLGRGMLQGVVGELMADGASQSKLGGLSSAFRAGVPQLFADVDREKVRKVGVRLQDVFSTLSAYLGSRYVNDFNKFGRTWQVNVQADSIYRSSVDDFRRLQVRNVRGEMVPLASLLKVSENVGPDLVTRYNLYPAAVVNGAPAPGVSSGEALSVVEGMLADKLPNGMGFEWTGLSLQEKSAAGQGSLVFALALLVVYLILAALYESWSTPLAVILSIPLAVLGAMAGLIARGMDNNVYTQVGLVLLVGLGAKNAILIVEFARDYHGKGKPIVESAVEAARLRLRPIIMTALAFILGVYPLVFATGAGAASRQAIGTAVFFGMIGNTLLGLLFTPVLYVVITAVTEKIFGKPKPPQPDQSPAAATPVAAPAPLPAAPAPAH